MVLLLVAVLVAADAAPAGPSTAIVGWSVSGIDPNDARLLRTKVANELRRQGFDVRRTSDEELAGKDCLDQPACVAHLALRLPVETVVAASVVRVGPMSQVHLRVFSDDGILLAETSFT